MSRQYRYRKCTITRKWVTTKGPRQVDEWEWIEDDYDIPNYGTGPCGNGRTIQDCKDDIDFYFDE